MIIAGIDPGLKGGIAVVEDTIEEGLHVECIPMPTATGFVKSKKSKRVDWLHMGEFFDTYRPDFVYIEKVNAMKGQGITSMFNFGGSFMGCVAVCEALGIPFRLVGPKEWQKALFPIYEGKDSAIAYVENKYHDVDLVLPRCRKPHDGMADAICIADYGLSIECTK